MSYAIFERANLNGAGFIGATLYNIGLEYADLAYADFRDSDIFKSHLCSGGNLIWQTTMPDGTIEEGPYYGGW